MKELQKQKEKEEHLQLQIMKSRDIGKTFFAAAEGAKSINSILMQKPKVSKDPGCADIDSTPRGIDFAEVTRV
jgi:hypothetical protein